ncbi:ragulator complex protein lamtor5 [Anaeramoeba ignava]|uniref:Ragulator complex protein lamtor5 n=1 Tax=Anaeramoeba ignava TaxID=1746090 RepID=A0A9Q0LNC0_ANAIG|nr:ragulator complex protein lamtor5 [Anaeramoeba ignava]
MDEKIKNEMTKIMKLNQADGVIMTDKNGLCLARSGYFESDNLSGFIHSISQHSAELENLHFSKSKNNQNKQEMVFLTDNFQNEDFLENETSFITCIETNTSNKNENEIYQKFLSICTKFQIIPNFISFEKIFEDSIYKTTLITSMKKIYEENFKEEKNINSFVKNFFAISNPNFEILLHSQDKQIYPAILQLRPEKFHLIYQDKIFTFMFGNSQFKMIESLDIENIATLENQEEKQNIFTFQFKNKLEKEVVMKTFEMFSWYYKIEVEEHEINTKILGENDEIEALLLRCLNKGNLKF